MRTKLFGFFSNENMERLARYVGSCDSVFYGIHPGGDDYMGMTRVLLRVEDPSLSILGYPLFIQNGEAESSGKSGRNIRVTGHSEAHYRDKKVAVFSDLPVEDTAKPFAIAREMRDGHKGFMYVLCTPTFEMFTRDQLYRNQLMSETRNRTGVMKVEDLGEMPLRWLKKRRRFTEDYFKGQDVAFIAEVPSGASPFAMAYALYLTDNGHSVVYMPFNDDNGLESIRTRYGNDMAGHRVMTFGDEESGERLREPVDRLVEDVGVKKKVFISIERIRADLGLTD